jgi:protein gp37
VAEETHISWADATFNHVRGCTKVSDGCKFCYAETLSKRNMKVLGQWGPQGTRVPAAESYWKEPLKWNAEAEKSGVRKRVFCASLADVFEGPETCNTEAYLAVRSARVRLFDLIEKTPHLDWLLLTKRPQNWKPLMIEVYDAGFGRDRAFRNFMVAGWLDGKAPANVWIGTSVENQKAADERIPDLLQIPAAVRFLSCEPLLGAVNFSLMNGRADFAQRLGRPALENIHWVIAGGESGPSARPMHPDWARSLRDQCVAAGVAFHFKQFGEWEPVDQPWLQDSPKELAENERWLNLDGGHGFHGEQVWRVHKVGKKAAGRLLDGRTWDELPEVAQ